MSETDPEGPWTCGSCGTDNQAADEHCQQCDRWRTDEYDPEDCVDSTGDVYPEHDYRGNECRRCGAEAEDEEADR